MVPNVPTELEHGVEQRNNSRNCKHGEHTTPISSQRVEYAYNEKWECKIAE